MLLGSELKLDSHRTLGWNSREAIRLLAKGDCNLWGKSLLALMWVAQKWQEDW